MFTSRRIPSWLTLLLLAMLLVAPAAEAATASSAAGATPKHGELWPYRGLGTWVDIFNWDPWRYPVHGVQRMKDAGVQTIYVETSRYTKNTAFVFKEEMGRLLEAAHAENMRVVAWYLPGLKDIDQDLRRSRMAIRYRSPNGHRFDAFALNLECDEILNIDLRNRRAIRLSQRLKRSVPRSYGLGTIVVDPVHAFYWPRFPYRRLGRIYDVMLPMSYWSYREVFAPRQVARFARENIRAIRKKTRGLDIGIHLPGGIARATSLDATRAFVRTVKEEKILGGGLYDWALTQDAQWPIVRRLRADLR